jgi:hypothetical protein
MNSCNVTSRRRSLNDSSLAAASALDGTANLFLNPLPTAVSKPPLIRKAFVDGLCPRADVAEVRQVRTTRIKSLTIFLFLS